MKQRSLDKFIVKEQHRLFKFILGKVKNPEVAEDLTQECLIRFVERVRSRGEIRNYNHYLYTIAKNQVYDYWRKAANDLEERESYWREIQINKIARTFPAIDQDKEIIYKHIARQITEQQRKVFFMNRIEGLSYSDIAKRLHLSKSTVKNHMVAALKIIRAYMEEHGDKLIIVAGVCAVSL